MVDVAAFGDVDALHGAGVCGSHVFTLMLTGALVASTRTASMRKPRGSPQRNFCRCSRRMLGYQLEISAQVRPRVSIWPITAFDMTSSISIAVADFHGAEM